METSLPKFSRAAQKILVAQNLGGLQPPSLPPGPYAYAYRNSVDMRICHLQANEPLPACRRPLFRNRRRLHAGKWAVKSWLLLQSSPADVRLFNIQYFLESHIKVIKVNFVKNDECAKNSSRVWPNIQMRWQKVGCWQLAIFRKMTLCEGGEFSNNSFEVCQNSNEMTNEACWLLAISTKMTNLAKIANLARSN